MIWGGRPKQSEFESDSSSSNNNNRDEQLRAQAAPRITDRSEVASPIWSPSNARTTSSNLNLALLWIKSGREIVQRERESASYVTECATSKFAPFERADGLTNRKSAELAPVILGVRRRQSTLLAQANPRPTQWLLGSQEWIRPSPLYSLWIFPFVSQPRRRSWQPKPLCDFVGG